MGHNIIFGVYHRFWMVMFSACKRQHFEVVLTWRDKRRMKVTLFWFSWWLKLWPENDWTVYNRIFHAIFSFHIVFKVTVVFDNSISGYVWPYNFFYQYMEWRSYVMRCTILDQTLTNSVRIVGQNAILTSQNAFEWPSQESVSQSICMAFKLLFDI